MTPGPTNIPPRVMRAMMRPIINHRGPEFKELQESVLEDAKYVFQTKGDMFVLTCSGTGGIECALGNIISYADKIVVPISGVFGERLRNAVQLLGGRPVEIPIDWKRTVGIEEIEDVVKNEGDVKAIAVVCNETSAGTKVNCMKEIGEFCRENDLIFIADAISILGGDHMPVDEWNIDICITGSQKCLMTPPGLTLVSVSDKAWSVIEKAKRPFYFDLKPYKKYQEEGQTPYTPALPLFYALDEALKMIREEGLEKAIARHRTCAEALYRAVEAMGLETFAEKQYRSNTVVGVKNPPGVSDSALRARLREKYNVVVAGGQSKLKGTMFRIGVMGMVSQAVITQTVGALSSALADLGYTTGVGEGPLRAREVFEKAH